MAFMAQTLLQVYTRNGCPLCEKAIENLLALQSQHSFRMEEIDIAKSDELTERYGIMIPVILIDGEEVAFGKIDTDSISKRLHEKNTSF